MYSFCTDSFTVSALTLLHNVIVKFLDSSGCVRVLSIDFAEAFDKILHSRVIDKFIEFDQLLLKR